MKDDFLREHFEQPVSHSLSIQERNRIKGTHALVPENWGSLIDVGCGDGCVSNPLFAKGIDVLGVDWSENSLRYCEFPTVCGDITQLEIPDSSYDGAICAEVLEHLTPEQASAVIGALIRITRNGFIISVPAYENLAVRTVGCAQCQKNYHVFGHLQSFQSFEDVDTMVGQKSVARAFVAKSSTDSTTLDRLRRSYSVYPWVNNALCPYCGAFLKPPATPSLPIRIFLRLAQFSISFMQKIRRQQGGWFICCYSTQSRPGDEIRD